MATLGYRHADLVLSDAGRTVANPGDQHDLQLRLAAFVEIARG